jgi:hypothetical protein
MKEQDYSTIWTEWAAANSRFAKAGVSSSKDSFVVKETFVSQIKLCSKIPLLRVAANRWPPVF